MNIFILDRDPVKCAEMMVDSHVVKMILETGQILSTTHRVLDGKKRLNTKGKYEWVIEDDIRDDILYKATHINHPCSIWTRQSVQNYEWLLEHFYALSEEFKYRFNKSHLTYTKLHLHVNSPPYNLTEWEMTPFALAMDESYMIDKKDPVACYRNYYKYGKSHLHKWTKRNKPDWLN